MDINTTNNYSEISTSILPKKLDGSDEGRKIVDALNSSMKSVSQGNEYLMPTFPLKKAIKEALNIARRTGRIIRGIEEAEKVLEVERAGILSVDMKTGAERVERISRLVIVANDGSDRFYRQTRRIVERNKPRVMAIHLDATSLELGEAIFGPGKRALFLLLNHKDAVINLLISLIN